MKIKIVNFFFSSVVILFLVNNLYAQSWKELNDSVLKYMDKEDFQTAIDLGEKALKMAKREFGDKDSNYATSLTNLALSYEDLGQFEKAEPLFLKTLGIYKEVLGEKHPEYATSI